MNAICKGNLRLWQMGLEKNILLVYTVIKQINNSGFCRFKERKQ